MNKNLQTSQPIKHMEKLPFIKRYPSRGTAGV